MFQLLESIVNVPTLGVQDQVNEDVQMTTADIVTYIKKVNILKTTNPPKLFY